GVAGGGPPMISVRNVLAGLGVAFTAYLAVRGLVWTVPVPSPQLMVITFAVYLVVTWLCIFFERRSTLAPASARDDDVPLTAGPRGPVKLPLWAAIAALVCAVAVPSAVSIAVGPELRSATFATWYLGG